MRRTALPASASRHMRSSNRKRQHRGSAPAMSGRGIARHSLRAASSTSPLTIFDGGDAYASAAAAHAAAGAGIPTGVPDVVDVVAPDESYSPPPDASALAHASDGGDNRVATLQLPAQQQQLLLLLQHAMEVVRRAAHAGCTGVPTVRRLRTYDDALPEPRALFAEDVRRVLRRAEVRVGMAAGTRAVRSQVRRTLLSRWRHWRELTQRSVRAMLGTTAQRMTAVIFRWQQRALHCAWARLRRTRSEQRSAGAAAADSGVHRNGLKAMRAPGLVPRREMGAVSSSSQTVPSGSHMDSQSSVWHLGAPLALTARSPMSQTEHAFEHWAHDGAAGRVLADVAHYRKCVSRVSLRRLLLAMRRRATALAWRLWRISWWHARCNAVALARLLSRLMSRLPACRAPRCARTGTTIRGCRDGYIFWLPTVRVYVKYSRGHA